MNITELQKNFISKIEDYSFDFCKFKFLKTFPEIDMYQYLLIEDCLRDFYIGCFVLSPEVELSPPNNYVDELWHQHILFTSRYSDFCFDFFGGYLHHEPIPPDRKIEHSKELELRNNSFIIGTAIKNERNYKLGDLNKHKMSSKFSLLSQINSYLNEVPYEEVLENFVV